MNSQMNQPGLIFRHWSAVITLMFVFFFVNSATATDSLMYIGKLLVPGTNSFSDHLTTSQSGILLEKDQVTLAWLSDGNLEMKYCNKLLLWRSSLNVNNGAVLAFQKSDGKLAIKNSSGDVIWSSAGTTASKLQLKWNHNLVMFDGSNKEIWSSSTGSNLLQRDDEKHTISFSESTQEFMIPPDCPYKYLYLHAEGADGGKRRVKETWGSVRFQVAGGSGATIIGIFEIGTGPTMIPPGSSIRISIGASGGTLTDQGTGGCGGGGGTIIMVRKPNDTYWHLLLVAGGGGGGYSDCCAVKREGRSAETTEDGGLGGGDKYPGGKNGADGEPCYQMNHPEYNGGGGINKAGWANKITILGPNDYAVTGIPGYIWSGQQCYGGGGGGGFSGGGAGQNYYPGGGGGSYVNTDLAVTEFRKKNDPTTDTSHGFVEYQFGSDFFRSIHMDKYTGSCLTDQNDQTGNGTSILLSTCNNSASQTWFLQGLTMKLSGHLDKCLDLPLSDTYVGNGIQLYDCNGTKAQVWIYDGISKNIRSGLDMSKCFHAADGSNPNMSNNRVTLWDCKDVDNMRWGIIGANNPTISSTQNRILFAGNTKKCVDVAQSNTSNGTNIQIYDCNYSAAQYWYFDGIAIHLNKDRNKCLDLSQSKTDNGTNIQLYDCDDTNAQKWTYNGISRTFHSWVDPEKCIDLSNGNTANGTNIQLWDCQEGNTNQRFEIGQ